MKFLVYGMKMMEDKVVALTSRERWRLYERDGTNDTMVTWHQGHMAYIGVSLIACTVTLPDMTIRCKYLKIKGVFLD